jgi:hypothetical protein
MRIEVERDGDGWRWREDRAGGDEGPSLFPTSAEAAAHAQDLHPDAMVNVVDDPDADSPPAHPEGGDLPPEGVPGEPDLI